MIKIDISCTFLKAMQYYTVARAIVAEKLFQVSLQNWSVKHLSSPTSDVYIRANVRSRCFFTGQFADEPAQPQHSMQGALVGRRRTVAKSKSWSLSYQLRVP
jgi:hypothetical protein